MLLLLAICLFFTACGKDDSSSTEEKQPADLTGQWKQVNSETEESYQAAMIDEDTITIYWVDEDTDSYSLYWAGTFIAPTTAEEPYSWDSENDHDKTDYALLASTDNTKTITYENDQLSYSASALGTTQVVKLERAEGVLDVIAELPPQEQETAPALQEPESTPQEEPEPVPQEEPEVYPKSAQDFFEIETITEPEDSIFDSSADANIPEGTIYKVIGTVEQIAVLQNNGENLEYIKVKTDRGMVAVWNPFEVMFASIESTLDREHCESYYVMPSVEEYVCIYSEYSGFSDILGCPLFIYGGEDYMLTAMLDSIVIEDSADTSEPEDTSGAGESAEAATTGQQNALQSAKSYLLYSAFSYEGLIDQLEYEGFTTEEATYAVDHCGADWSAQALASAKTYLSFSAFSYKGLIDQLEYEKFTSEQATYAADNCGADWFEQAALCAESYLSYSSFSKNELISQLEYEGFTHEQAVYGVEQNDL